MKLRTSPSGLLTPAAVAAFRASDEQTLRRELRLRPWEHPTLPPLDVVSPYPSGSAGTAWWPRGQELHRLIEAAGGMAEIVTDDSPAYIAVSAKTSRNKMARFRYDNRSANGWKTPNALRRSSRAPKSTAETRLNDLDELDALDVLIERSKKASRRLSTSGPYAHREWFTHADGSENYIVKEAARTRLEVEQERVTAGDLDRASRRRNAETVE